MPQIDLFDDFFIDLFDGFFIIFIDYKLRQRRKVYPEVWQFKSVSELYASSAPNLFEVIFIMLTFYRALQGDHILT